MTRIAIVGDAAEKRRLLDDWLAAHIPGNVAPLFARITPAIRLRGEAEALLERVDRVGLPSLYLACLGQPPDPLIPMYIGKSNKVWKRWKRGHMRLLGLSQRTGSGTYAFWLPVLEGASGRTSLLCLAESAITAPPLPGFPTTVGSVEYQLIALAAEVYPETLLNDLGVPR